MNQELGTKGGKKNRKLSFLNKKRKRELKNKEIIQEKEKEIQQRQKKKEEEIRLTIEKQNKPEQLVTTPIELDKELKSIKQPPIENFIIQEKQPENKVKDVITYDDVKKDNDSKKEDILVERPKRRKKVGSNNSNKIDSPTHSTKKINEEKEKEEDTIDFIEKQIIKVLEQDVEEKKFQLKKIDSEIHTMLKTLDEAKDEEELDKINEEIERLMTILEQIKMQILSLEKTFDFKFPVEEPDNYLIYLVEEYKQHRKEEKDFDKKLHDNKEFKSLIDYIIEVEEKHEIIKEKMQDKKDQLDLDEEKIEKLNNNVVDIEEINKKIKIMIEQNKKIQQEIEHKLNETVHITERVETITKNVDHTMLELFLLMAILKHNLSIKNNAVAAVTAALALDMIIKMTTPIKEKVVVKDYNFNDYEKMINNCINDTNSLEKMLDNNLENISSIRYTFEKDYKSCSYLPSYQEALDKISRLEEDMKERKQDVIKMKKEVELQLEKNNAKVKKYSEMKATCI